MAPAGLLRTIIAILIGIAIAGATIAVIEWVGQAFYPPPGGIDMTDPGAMGAALVEAAPGAQIFVLIAWFFGSLVGGFAARIIANRWIAPIAVALAVSAAVLWTTTLFPHPWWMVLSGLALPLLAGLLVARRGRRAVAAVDRSATVAPTTATHHPAEPVDRTDRPV